MCRANQRSRQLWGVIPVAYSTVISPRVSLYVTLGHPVQLFVLMKAWCDVPISRHGHRGRKAPILRSAKTHIITRVKNSLAVTPAAPEDRTSVLGSFGEHRILDS